MYRGWGQYKFIFFHQNFAFFPSGVANACNQFSWNIFNKFKNCLQIMIKVLEFYKTFAAWKEIAAQLTLHFQSGKCVVWNKTEKKRWISQTPFNRFSSSFHQNNHTESGHLILGLENVGQSQNLQKLSFLKFKNIADGKKITRGSVSASYWPMTIVFVSKNVAPFFTFSTFPGRVENKVLQISEITQHFKNCFTDYVW